MAVSLALEHIIVCHSSQISNLHELLDDKLRMTHMRERKRHFPTQNCHLVSEDWEYIPLNSYELHLRYIYGVYMSFLEFNSTGSYSLSWNGLKRDYFSEFLLMGLG